MLPTGSGKTLVASMAIHTWLQNAFAADKIAVFLAPTSQLTRQQAHSVSQFLDLFACPLGLGEGRDDGDSEELSEDSKLLVRLRGSAEGGGGGGGGDEEYCYRVLKADWYHPKYWGLLYKALDAYKQALLDILEVGGSRATLPCRAYAGVRACSCGRLAL